MLILKTATEELKFYSLMVKQRNCEDEGSIPSKTSIPPLYPNQAEEAGLEPVQCGFESHRGHHNKPCMVERNIV